MSGITIVVPVYGDWPSLKDCIESLGQCVDTKRNRILLLNDNGPDADEIEKRIKAAIRSRAGFSYERNGSNLGFLKTCNRAVLELDKTKNDILLLNSDTKVTAGFLEEMAQVLYLDTKHGVVSPRTNNATIATVPISAISQKGIEPAAAFETWQKLKGKIPRFSEVPTAHGFCMLIRRNLIKEYGLFDEVFGKGYGEEVDFCQRVSKHGYKSLLANRAFVFHLEARSFTHEVKAKLLEQNNQIIRQRYPKYQDEVRAYIKQALKIEGKLGFGSNLLKILRRHLPAN